MNSVLVQVIVTNHHHHHYGGGRCFTTNKVMKYCVDTILQRHMNRIPTTTIQRTRSSSSSRFYSTTVPNNRYHHQHNGIGLRRLSIPVMGTCSARSFSNDSSSNNSNSSTVIKSMNTQTPYNICFVRHGQSTWNRDNRFIGWTDTPLTDDGIIEARVAGQMLLKSGMKFDEVHTSLLRRSIRTSNIICMELEQEYIPMYKHVRLNERHYGNLVGYHKKEMVSLYGKEQVKRWRRSYDEPPPPMTEEHPYHIKNDIRYQHLLLEQQQQQSNESSSSSSSSDSMNHIQLPVSESLKDTVIRSSVYWHEVILPALALGKTLLIVGHENNLRSLIMQMENIAPKDIINLSLPRAVPLAYKLEVTPISQQQQQQQQQTTNHQQDTNTNEQQQQQQHVPYYPNQRYTCRPINPRSNGQLDEATGFLRGVWLGGDQAVHQILNRDDKQVYDTSIQENLELISTTSTGTSTSTSSDGEIKIQNVHRDTWNTMMTEFVKGTTTVTTTSAAAVTSPQLSEMSPPLPSSTTTTNHHHHQNNTNSSNSHTNTARITKTPPPMLDTTTSKKHAIMK